MSGIWRKCSSCKRDILLNAPYYVCSVSTCQGRVTNYVFCSVTCWDAHLPIERHRSGSAGAIERKAPSQAAPEGEPKKIFASGSPKAPAAATGQANEDEILVVVSKVKKYITDKSGMNTSASTFEKLSDKIRNLCDAAIQVAREQGRKTVMDRDFS